ncbi:hypothetical protein OHS33_20805 [Streptomyces sp. NBC_00536]|uniref:hypothetical protein n=1 Tax=Streptomyces sp. NBC_00536 TaxID=2975769 RepID=UPI002E8122DE|nr:hypothetical protein [Streptomyces sp. NBC_00536]WUC80544.1 hypothetical protein OHS33_20805 [Streptomyces sp. NBC_00536]
MSKHSRPRSRTPRSLAVAATLGLVVCSAGWAYAVHDRGDRERRAEAALDAHARAGGDGKGGKGGKGGTGAKDRADRAARGAERGAPSGLPDVSAATLARIPADARQLVLVTGRSKDSSEGTAALYTRADAAARWSALGSWPARNGAKGWSTERTYGDLTSPQGVFSLTDAGGLLPAPPGTRLPYDKDRSFVPSGRGVNGESLAGSFDYVVAVDFNRERGVSPLDPTKPEGEKKGGNIWLHVDHDGPSQGCVGIPEAGMRKVLETLDPAAKPVIVMGPAGF